MLTRQLFLAVICTLTSTLKAQELSLKTVSLSNSRFIASSNWNGLTLSNAGEDSNSEKYGLVYPAQEDGMDAIVTQPTLAREVLYIKVEIVNATDQYWQVKSIELEVVESLKLEDFSFREGLWASSSIKTTAYMPYFIIDEKLTESPRNLPIGPSADFSDNRFWIKVGSFGSQKSPDMISRFQLACTLMSKGNGQKKTIKSDKFYLLASG